MAPTTDDISKLQALVRGDVLPPSAPEYHVVRQVFNARESRRPTLAVRCRGAADVIACVAFAREHGLQMSVKGGGHGATGFAVCDDGLLIDFSLMRGVTLHPDTRTATVQAGALWRDVYHEAAALDLVPAGGTCDMVGVAGSTLGGGWGSVSRRFGLTIDNLESVQMVTADARLVTASVRQHPDLFWALRGGGGGNFGVVTSFEFRLHPLPREVLAGYITWPYDHAPAVLAAYRDHVLSGPPDDLYVDFNLYDDQDGKAVGIGCVYLGVDSGDGITAVRRFLDLAEPSVDLKMRPYASVLKEYAEDIVQGRLQLWKSGFLDPQISAATIDTIVRQFAKAPAGSSPVLFIETLGGAISRVDAKETAYPHRHELMCLTVVADWDDVAMSAATESWVRSFKAAVAPGLTGGAYVNYVDAELADWSQAYYGNNYARLVQVKRAWDPDGFFRFPQSIGSA